MKKKVPFEIIVKANKLDATRFTGDGFEVTEVVSGDKCSNGGEYGFTSIFTKTSIPGVYFWERTTTAEYTCGTGPQGFVILTNEKVARIRAASKRITDAAYEAWDEYQWGNGPFPHYTGDSCRDEIAAIIAGE